MTTKSGIIVTCVGIIIVAMYTLSISAAAAEAQLCEGEGRHGGGDERDERVGHGDEQAVAYGAQEGEP